MSASPAERTPGRTPGRTPNGTLLPPMRRPRPPADPLMRPKRRGPRPQPSAAPSGGKTGSAGLVTRPGGSAAAKTSSFVQNAPKALPPMSENPALNILGSTGDTIHSGFTSEPLAPYVDYPLVMTKRQLMEGMRSHVARFFTKKNIDPRNEEEFTRPVRLHRRDARAPAPGSKEVELDAKDGEAAEEREKQDLARAEREAKREAEMAEVAPSANQPSQKRTNNQKKKTQQIFRHDQTEAQRAGTKLRYEEALQWHLEDFDNKQSWVGNYEAALSETYAQIVFEDGQFRVTPIEKWYKFMPKLHFKTPPTEDAEKELEKKAKVPDWFLKHQEQQGKNRMEEQNRRATSRLFVGKMAGNDAGVPGTIIKREAGEVDELDFEEDRFADDEEPDVFEGDQDDTKETQDRIKRDQLQANFFDLKDEKSYDKAEVLEKAAKQAEKEHGKRVKKALMKRERNYIYDSEDSENPYSEKSESTDSEAEREKEEQAKKEAEEKEKEKLKGTQPGSGASSKGNNTPSKSNKHLDPSAQRNLKRSGNSTNVSEASGNESSRKKQKKKHVNFDAAGNNTPNGVKSRSRSPAVPGTINIEVPTSIPQRKLSTALSNVGPDTLKRGRSGAGSGSDGEGAASGGDMSDGSRKRLKINIKKQSMSSTNASPDGSRSPSVERNNREAQRGRAGSPGGKAASAASAFPTPAEVAAAIPEGGISIGELFKKLHPGGQMAPDPKAKVFKILRDVSQYDKSTKLLKRLKAST